MCSGHGLTTSTVALRTVPVPVDACSDTVSRFATVVLTVALVSDEDVKNGLAMLVVPMHCAYPEPTKTPEEPRLLIVATPSMTHPLVVSVDPPASAVEAG